MNVSATVTAAEAAQQRWDVIVIGAGPAGATAAILLAQAGRKVLLVDRKPFPRQKVCGGCLSAAAVALLEKLGVASQLISAGAQPLHSLELRAGEAVANLALPSGLSVTRTTLDALLVERAVACGAAFLPATTAHVTNSSGYRVHLQTGNEAVQEVSPGVILVADGLGHPSLRAAQRFAQRVSPASRIGAGCLLVGSLPHLASHTVSMVIGRHGYVGLVHVEGSQTSIAAALDPQLVRRHHGVASACQQVLQEAGIQVYDDFVRHDWHATPALTRTTLRHADANVFLLGDASGYVEPFTGEGMTWAMSAAVDVLPFVERALAGQAAAREWTGHVTRMAQRRQRWCRLVSRSLRSPWLTAATVRLLHVAPLIAQPVVHWITERRTPELAKVPS